MVCTGVAVQRRLARTHYHTGLRRRRPVDEPRAIRRALRQIVIDPQHPGTLYVGTAQNGVFKSSDAGATWRPSSIGLPKTGHVGISALAIDPSVPNVLYLGLSLEGLFKTTDGGAHWSLIKADSTSLSWSISIAIGPMEPTTLYIAGDYGLWKSTDGGGTWTLINLGYLTGPLISVIVDPTVSTTPTTLYAGTARGVYDITIPPVRSVYLPVIRK